MVDDIRILSKDNVVRRVHEAIRLQHPVLEAIEPWEGWRVYLYGTVARDASTGIFSMWYGAHGGVLFAESDDGLVWRKPELDVFLWEGRKTNIVIKKSSGVSVLVDPADPDPTKRYKALVAESIKVGGFFGYYSADGLHWKRYNEDRLLDVGSEVGNLIRDPATGRYFAYIRPYAPKHYPKNVNQKRLGAMVTSDDFVHWSQMKITLVPDALDDAWVKTPVQRTEFYAMNGFAYGNSYLGVIPLFRITAINEKAIKGQSRYDGPMEGQLICSRDGLEWSRLADRSPVIPSGETFDCSVMNVATEPLVVGNEIWLYYTAINTTHGGPPPAKRISIALAKWRLDGFVSLDAGVEVGVIETIAFPAEETARGLKINAVTDGGQVAVEVLDESGKVLSGYGAIDSVVFRGDEVAHQMLWKTRASLPIGKPYRLRFVMQQASLFSYRTVPQ